MHAATITVNTTDDELNSDGDCSLREAIKAANTNLAVDACPAGSGADTITVPTGTYTLSIAGTGEDNNVNGDLDVLTNISFEGAGIGTTTINGGAIERVFDVRAGASASFDGLTITNGTSNQGGGIRHNNVVLTITNSSIRRYPQKVCNQSGGVPSV